MGSLDPNAKKLGTYSVIYSGIVVRDRLKALLASGPIRPLRRQQCGF